MSYKENKNYKKYCKKYKDVNKTINTLENFCKQHNCTMEIFGSLLRKDYYYGKSDIDMVLITNNVDKTSSEFEYFINRNPYIKLKAKKIVSYGANKDTINCTGILHKISVNNNGADVCIVGKKDYKRHHEFIKPTFGPITFFIMGIIKFFFYQVPLIPLSYYLKAKEILYKKRLHIVKKVKK